MTCRYVSDENLTAKRGHAASKGGTTIRGKRKRPAEDGDETQDGDNEQAKNDHDEPDGDDGDDGDDDDGRPQDELDPQIPEYEKVGPYGTRDDPDATEDELDEFEVQREEKQPPKKRVKIEEQKKPEKKPEK